MRRIFTVLFVNFFIVFLSLLPAFAKSKDPLDRLIIGAFTGGMLIVLYYGLKAIWRLFKKEKKGVRPWLTTSIIGGIAILLLIVIGLIAFNRQPPRTTDYTHTTSAPSSSPLLKEQPTSSQPLSSLPTEKFSSIQPPSETKMDAVEWYDKGNSLLKSGEYKKAIDAYGRAIDLNPQFADAYANRGTAAVEAYSILGFYGYYLEFGNSRPSLRDFNKAIELNPNNAVFYVNRGNAYLVFWGSSMTYFATEDFKKACELGDRNACNMLKDIQ